MRFLSLTPTTAQQLATIRANQTQIIIPDLTQILANQKTILTILTKPAPVAAAGHFNPPANLVIIKPVEVPMSVMQLEVGQTAVGKMTFNEPAPPADGAVMSDTPAVATIALGADLETWTCVAVSVGTANVTYAGTSAPPDLGPAVVPPMIVTVVAVPVAEQGDFNPSGATITGP